VTVQWGIGRPPLEVSFQGNLGGVVKGNETALANFEQRMTRPSAVMSSKQRWIASDTRSPVHANRAKNVL
jgi:hypothetical protein